MKKGKYSVSSFGKLKGKRRMVAALALALILICTVSGTLAYVFMNTDPVENTFTPSAVATAVVEDGVTDPVTGGSVTDVETKSNVKIKNAGNTTAYIRAAIVVTWKKADGTVYAMKPQAGTDYVMVIPTDTGWVKSGDYYYYNSPVDSKATTNVLIASCAPVAGKAPDGYVLSVEIIASGIQSTGMGATSVQDAWAKAQGNN